MKNIYKITTPRTTFFFETENMIIVSVHNKQIEDYVGKNLMEMIKDCEVKGYSLEKCKI